MEMESHLEKREDKEKSPCSFEDRGGKGKSTVCGGDLGSEKTPGRAQARLRNP